MPRKTIVHESRLRKICLALPQTTERLSHSAPSWFFKDKKSWCAAGPGVQEDLIASNPKQFFRPPYVGGRGWRGLRLDGKVDWALTERLCAEAYRVVSGAK